MRTYIDQMGREVIIPENPQRIISLVPSLTELLFDLGLDQRIVGLTKFCIHPQEKCRGKKIIGGTKQFHFDRIAALSPDLIIANKEENYQEGIEKLAETYPVWLSDIFNIQDVVDMITQIGIILNCSTETTHLTKKMKDAFRDYAVWKKQQLDKKPKVAYLIWRKPYMVVGKNNFIHSLLKEAGFQNVFAHLDRYPVVSLKELAVAQPEWVLLSSEPFPFKAEKHFSEFQSICPKAKLKIVDGELFSWYGSRLLKSADYFKRLIAEMKIHSI